MVVHLPWLYHGCRTMIQRQEQGVEPVVCEFSGRVCDCLRGVHDREETSKKLELYGMFFVQIRPEPNLVGFRIVNPVGTGFVTL